LKTATGKREAGCVGKSLSLSFISGLHVIALYTLAVSHPLYAVLGRADHAPFFIAHQLRSIDIWLFVLIFSIVLPAAICLALWLTNLLSRRLGSGLFMLLLFILIFASFLPVPERWLGDSGELTIILPLIAAALTTGLYVFTAWARTFVTIMSLAIVISPVLFLSTGSIRSVLSKHEAQAFSIATQTDDRPDIVMIVFDELPLISLLDQNLELDSERYSNFQRLAKTATWYKNTTTVHISTSHAITSLLVGEEYRKYLEMMHETPVSVSGPIDRARIPRNLFSLLEKQYKIFANELVTRLAPESPETGVYLPPLKERLLELVVDSSIVYAHLISPERLRGTLPQIEGQWRGFSSTGSENQISLDWPFEDSFKRVSTIRQFIESLQKRNAPSFYFLHSLMPHYPFVYNERGQIHSNRFSLLTMHFREATGSNDWPNEQTADLAHQAHLLQLEFTDLLLGRVLDRLEAQGIFENSLLIVTSDHGTSYYWDREHLPADQLAEIQASGTLYVPLIIKLPGQTSGLVSNKPLQTIDIVPTIADILGLEISWPISGFSAHGAVPDDRERFSHLPDFFRVNAALEHNDHALRRKFELFGTKSTERIYYSGPYPEVVNQPLTSFPSMHSNAIIRLRVPKRIVSVDPEATRLPAYVDGQIIDLPEQFEASELTLAIAVNGIIRNTTKTTQLDTSSLRPRGRDPSWDSTVEASSDAPPASQPEAYFLARLPPGAYVRGRNEVTVHAIISNGRDGAISLVDFSYE
jgi:hypothetical protein